MEGIGLAVRVEERVGLGIEQVAGVGVFGGGIEHRGRVGVRRVCAFAAAEEVSDHLAGASIKARSGLSRGRGGRGGFGGLEQDNLLEAP